MRYLLSAHNQLTGEIDERRRFHPPKDQRNWERLVDEMRRSLFDAGVGEFEGYFELVDTHTGEQLYKTAVEWPK